MKPAKRSLFVVSVAVLCFVGDAIVCPPNYCHTVRCVNEDTCPETHVLSPTFCGCCNRCVPKIGEGGVCLQFAGSPSSALCDEGLICCRGSCQKECEREMPSSDKNYLTK
ncbi:uncharacterized protein LOC132703283 [Cylas formicarius]|uniref:uncharacterized protein LOC132703283 n=1 Tax=Cylas formicarius TaxID=197179 RepID=UPI002958AD10|nr:uncharacterized protein LOC132703283 [Cylas formicarius]